MNSPALRATAARSPGLGEVFAFADVEIQQAATELWPGAVIEPGAHVPSVTAYVRRMKVNGLQLYAKYSLLGVSLVSLLRGTCGDWDQVRRDQEEYVMRPDALLKREAAQLRFLTTLGHLKVCRSLGVRRGVLFTEPVPGPSLASLLLRRPAAAAEVLSAPLRELHPLHRPSAQESPDVPAVIGERSIARTFMRKFNGISGTTYLDRLGEQRCAPRDRGPVIDLLRQTVARLRPLRPAVLPATGHVVAFGDLKPEHVHFPDGPSGQPVFLDPGLLRGRAAVDAAKLVSRTALLLVASRPGDAAGQQITGGIDAVLHAQLARLPRRAREACLREFLVLWLMDTVNILTTYLSAPASLPLPARGELVVQRATVVCTLLDQLSDGLADGGPSDAVWEHGLTMLRAAAS